MVASGIDGSVLEGSHLFAGLSRTALDALAQRARPLALEHGQTLFRQGDESDGCYAILDGVLKVSIVGRHDDEILLAMLGAGEVIGEMGLINSEPRSATATALAPCSLAFLATEDFWQFADTHPPIYRHMLEILSNRLRDANEYFTLQLQLPLGGRLARLFLRLAEVFGHPLDGGRILVREKFTQTDLARMTASARENVNRQLAEWRKAGIVSQISRYYCVEDAEKLRQIAGLSPDLSAPSVQKSSI